jgi:hypothetical protein
MSGFLQSMYNQAARRELFTVQLIPGRLGREYAVLDDVPISIPLIGDSSPLGEPLHGRDGNANCTLPRGFSKRVLRWSAGPPSHCRVSL